LNGNLSIAVVYLRKNIYFGSIQMISVTVILNLTPGYFVLPVDVLNSFIYIFF